MAGTLSVSPRVPLQRLLRGYVKLGSVLSGIGLHACMIFLLTASLPVTHEASSLCLEAEASMFVCPTWRR